jgi:hypothetical protein
VSGWAARAVEQVRERACGYPLDRSLRVTLNFHPDRVSKGATVLERLASEGVYRNQFETGTSNGGLTAYAGGDRWRWEQRIFGGAYDDAPPEERPKYGALNHRRRSVGAAIRFGSAHLRLAEHVLERTTFCFPDSVLEPAHFGTADRFDLLRLADAFDARTPTEVEERSLLGLLDDYIEAHVHGVIRVGRDVEALVLDPCYRGTSIEARAHLLARSVQWHEGRVLDVEELARHPDYRGRHIIEVGRRIADHGTLTAGREDPQDLKKVWHHIARFGQPAAA